MGFNEQEDWTAGPSSSPRRGLPSRRRPSLHGRISPPGFPDSSRPTMDRRSPAGFPGLGTRRLSPRETAAVIIQGYHTRRQPWKTVAVITQGDSHRATVPATHRYAGYEAATARRKVPRPGRAGVRGAYKGARVRLGVGGRAEHRSYRDAHRSTVLRKLQNGGRGLSGNHPTSRPGRPRLSGQATVRCDYAARGWLARLQGQPGAGWTVSIQSLAGDP